MICEQCEKHEAQVRVARIIDIEYGQRPLNSDEPYQFLNVAGDTRDWEQNLCPGCAAEYGVHVDSPPDEDSKQSRDIFAEDAGTNGGAK